MSGYCNVWLTFLHHMNTVGKLTGWASHWYCVCCCTVVVEYGRVIRTRLVSLRGYFQHSWWISFHRRTWWTKWSLSFCRASSRIQNWWPMSCSRSEHNDNGKLLPYWQWKTTSLLPPTEYGWQYRSHAGYSPCFTMGWAMPPEIAPSSGWIQAPCETRFLESVQVHTQNGILISLAVLWSSQSWPVYTQTHRSRYSFCSNRLHLCCGCCTA